MNGHLVCPIFFVETDNSYFFFFFCDISLVYSFVKLDSTVMFGFDYAVPYPKIIPSC